MEAWRPPGEMLVGMPHAFEPVPDARPDDRGWPEMVWPVDPDVRLAGDTVEVSLVHLARDGADLFAALDDERVWAHMSSRPGSVEEYVDRLGRSLALGRLPWVVRLRRPSRGLSAGSVVGTSSYLEVSVADARLEVGATAYSPELWGSTVNPEVKLLLLGHAFEVLQVGRVQLKTDVRNVRSQRAIERLGARHEGTLRRYQRRADGSVRDTVMFSVTAEEWPEVRRGLLERLGRANDRRGQEGRGQSGSRQTHTQWRPSASRPVNDPW
jgi:N-acetyltransferase